MDYCLDMQVIFFLHFFLCYLLLFSILCWVGESLLPEYHCLIGKLILCVGWILKF